MIDRKKKSKKFCFPFHHEWSEIQSVPVYVDSKFYGDFLHYVVCKKCGKLKRLRKKESNK